MGTIKNTVLADRAGIINYIPQREPMVMVHQLVEVTDAHAVSGFLIEAGNLFVEDGRLTEAGLIENIAQTAAAQAGYLCHQKNTPVPVGFIAAIRHLQVMDLPAVHTNLLTRVHITNNVFDVTFVQGTVEQAGRVLCRCEMKIFTRS